MSGGSFNYLGRAEALWEVWEKRSELASMIEALEEHAPDSAALLETRRIARKLDELDQLVGPITKVWHGVEWWYSCDYNEEDAREAIAEFGPTRSWWFTFGHGQYHPDGRHLLGWYVKIPANDYLEARTEMIRLFGTRWSDQYDNAADAGVESFGLQELELPVDPVEVGR